ncbi:ATP-binding protein [Hyphomicrobium sp.]|uniref:ATP-binding protein n=1 Tax=Hyphomicrobium sp. TaxID=82 RepID=UPI001D713D1C|nr:ATP-binding protein [Hyphomicrobium sp.]MBY0561010.1 ATP-dependent DNA helicase [Hyphomicrobium sp.]
MAGEHHHFEKKSLRKVMGGSADWHGLAESCVAFATANGGAIYIGIEDGDDKPPANQIIAPNLPTGITQRIGQLAVNVSLEASLHVSDNGGAYIELIIPRSTSVPSTSGGKYYLREGDRNRPIVGDEILRLLSDRATVSWESLTSAGIPHSQVDPAKLSALIGRIRASDRVKSSVKEKTDDELLEHYSFADGRLLTNLGILCIGRRQDRAALGTAPVVQFIKYDEHDDKLNKLVWDDFSLSPIELVDAIWTEVPDFRETYELPDGLFRKLVPAYDETVVRELLVNALVHRPYTQRGDIFLKSFPDRLEVQNPGPLPIGVTPATVLHVTVRRNEGLARVFHDLKLMDREGSGFDTMYEVLLGQGRDVPHLREVQDRVEVTIGRRILKPSIIDLLGKANQSYHLKQREMICLGLLAQAEHMTAKQLVGALMLDDVDELRPWLGRLQGFGLVGTAGRTKATRYFVASDVMRRLDIAVPTTLGRIEPHRLRALIEEDLRRYPNSAAGEINRRVGAEINAKQIKRALDTLVADGTVAFEGEKRWRRYRAVHNS